MKLKRLVVVIASGLLLATSSTVLTACGGSGVDTEMVDSSYTYRPVQQEAFSPEGTWQVAEASLLGIDALDATEVTDLMAAQMTVTFGNGVMLLGGNVEDYLVDYLNNYGENDLDDYEYSDILMSYSYENGILSLETGRADIINNNTIEIYADGMYLLLTNKDSSAVKNSVEGVWRIKKMTEHGLNYTALAELEGLEDQMTATFEDGILKMNVAGQTRYKTYTCADGVVILDGKDTAVIRDNILYFEFYDDVLILERDFSATVNANTLHNENVSDENKNILSDTTWDIIEVTVDGQVVTRAQLEEIYGSDIEMYFRFTDSVVISNVLGESETAEYTYSDGVVTIDGSNCTIDDDTMEFHVDGDVFKLQKR